MNNRYLQDRAMRRGGRGRDRNMGNMISDGRNPYGSRGGYVTSSRRGRDRAMDYGDYNQQPYNGMDYRYNAQYPNADYHMGGQQYGQYPMPMYEMYGVGGIQPMYDYNQGYMNDYARGRGRDYGYDYASNEEDKEWEEHLHKWIEKLKKYDKFNMPKEEIINKAKSMGVKFDKYNEHEFVATYYMMMSDYPSIMSDPHLALVMAKDFLEDKDSELKGSEKLCAYYYEIVKGGEED